MKDDPMFLHKSPHGVWYYRRPVVEADQLFWRGPTGKIKREWNLSLRTKDRRTAIDERYPDAHIAYQTERNRQLAAALERAVSEQKPAKYAPSRLAQDDPDYIDGLAQIDRDAMFRAEWEAEHDPMYEQREALRAETVRLRDAEASRELGRQIKAEEAAERAVTVTQLFEDWAATWGKPDTIAAYRSYLEHFTEHVAEHTGKTDANTITEDDVAAWRNYLREKGGRSGKPISNVTINGAYMAAINAVFAHARNATRKLASNPAADLPALRVKKKPQLRPKSIADNEAITILLAAMQPGGEKLSPQRQAAKRWCQWLMAYTGARVTEIAQLRKEDVGEVEGVPYVFITPDADLPPSEWPNFYFRIGHEGGMEWQGGTSRKRSSASCVRRRSCWRRAERWRMHAGGSA